MRPERPGSLKHFRGLGDREIMEGELYAHRAEAKVVPLISYAPATFFRPPK